MKAQLLKKLTNEELHLLGNITHSDIKKELESRKLKPKTEVKIGDCFYDKDEYGIYLIKITNFEGNDWFACDEIGIDKESIDCYETNYHIDAYSDWKPLNASLYESILALVKSREDAISKIKEQFDNQIRKLCQELNQNQEK